MALPSHCWLLTTGVREVVSNSVPASSSNAGKILLMGHSSTSSVADKTRLVLAQARVMTKCHEYLVHLQTTRATSSASFLLFENSSDLESSAKTRLPSTYYFYFPQLLMRPPKRTGATHHLNRVMLLYIQR